MKTFLPSRRHLRRKAPASETRSAQQAESPLQQPWPAAARLCGDCESRVRESGWPPRFAEPALAHRDQCRQEASMDLESRLSGHARRSAEEAPKSARASPAVKIEICDSHIREPAAGGGSAGGAAGRSPKARGPRGKSGHRRAACRAQASGVSLAKAGASGKVSRKSKPPFWVQILRFEIRERRG